MKRNLCVVPTTLFLAACGTPRLPPAQEVSTLEVVASIPPHMSLVPPEPVKPECRVEHVTAETVFATAVDGRIAWSVTFDVPSTQKIIERMKLTGSEASPDSETWGVLELDCQLDKVLRERCPNWMHDPDKKDPAVYLKDGRFQSEGFCDHE